MPFLLSRWRQEADLPRRPLARSVSTLVGIQPNLPGVYVRQEPQHVPLPNADFPSTPTRQNSERHIYRKIKEFLRGFRRRDRSSDLSPENASTGDDDAPVASNNMKQKPKKKETSRRALRSIGIPPSSLVKTENKIRRPRNAIRRRRNRHANRNAVATFKSPEAPPKQADSVVAPDSLRTLFERYKYHEPMQ